MSDWLPESSVPDSELAGRIVASVSARVARRRRTIKACSAALFAATVLGIGASLAIGLSRGFLDQPFLVASSESVNSHPADAEVLSVSKAEHAVRVQWEGRNDQEYTVFRCSSPRFDQCAVADRVRGTNWLDTAPGDDKITFYRVAPKG